MNSADLLRHRLEAAARESDRLDALLQAIRLLPDNIEHELHLLNWNEAERFAVVSLLLMELQRESSERLMP